MIQFMTTWARERMCHNKKETMKSIWIAREKDGSLNLFESKPSRDVCGIGIWFASSGTTSASIQNYLYPEVTWENSPIELVPKIMVDENTSLDECVNTIFKEKEG